MTHDHDHGGQVAGKRLTATLLVTATVFLAEILGAWWSGSLALAADAGHMLADSAGLVIALIASHLAARPRSNTYTWGLARSEAISAAFQAGMLLVICVSIAAEAMERLHSPLQIDTTLMAVIGLVGLAGNVVSLGILLGVRGENLNVRAAFLEVAVDSLSSVGVVVAALLAKYAQLYGADIVVSLLIAVVMAPRAWHLLRQSLHILLEATPPGLDLEDVRAHILRHKHVVDVHDLHVSTIATGTIALSAHVTLEDCCFRDGDSSQTLHQIQDCLAEHFPISLNHSTIQLDTAEHRDHEVLHHHHTATSHAH